MPIKNSKLNLKRLLRNLVELYQMTAPLRNSLVQAMVNPHLFPPFLSQVHHLLLLLWQVSYHQVPHLHPHLSQVVAPQHHHHLLVQVFQVILLL